ncbi:MAG: hypothetical protein CYPHOPRED_003497 [Cyphobasidiales sp. Tagirdzhanova-0007]|nr:MAG: hypothetical protein CYPHOPRED_003497 [Cyphobasidiales sp. Tagirdzhanova-0007]
MAAPQTRLQCLQQSYTPAAIKKLTEALAKMVAAMETMRIRVQGIENNILQMQMSQVAGHDALKNDFAEVSTPATRAAVSADTVTPAQVHVQETALRIKSHYRSIWGCLRFGRYARRYIEINQRAILGKLLSSLYPRFLGSGQVRQVMEKLTK